MPAQPLIPTTVLTKTATSRSRLAPLRILLLDLLRRDPKGRSIRAKTNGVDFRSLWESELDVCASVTARMMFVGPAPAAILAGVSL